MSFTSKLQVEIKDIGVHGEGIGKYQDLVIFVDGALPGELVEVSLTKLKKNYAKGSLLNILKVSPHREKPICPIFGICGGCQIMHLTYSEQLKVKHSRVKEAFRRIGKIDNPSILPCEPSPYDLHYRNKIQLPIVKDAKGCKIGLYKRESHDVVPVEQCFIHTDLGEKIFQEAKRLINKHRVLAYDPLKKEGDLRHLLIRTAIFEKKVLVVFISANPPSESLIKVAEELHHHMKEVEGVVHHMNSRDDNVVLDQNFNLLVGKSFIIEKLHHLYFKVSAASFFQVNPHQAIHLYQKAIQLAEIRKEDRVLDAYCGVGTLALFIAKDCHHVIGIESVPQAIHDAKENAKLNGIEAHVNFICAKVEDDIEQIQAVDVAFINPPRKGCEHKVLETLARMKPRTIIYISCDPATLARDAHLLISQGYDLNVAIPYDMFPQTMHVETVARFKRR